MGFFGDLLDIGLNALNEALDVPTREDVKNGLDISIDDKTYEILKIIASEAKNNSKIVKYNSDVGFPIFGRSIFCLEEDGEFFFNFALDSAVEKNVPKAFSMNWCVSPYIATYDDNKSERVHYIALTNKNCLYKGLPIQFVLMEYMPRLKNIFIAFENSEKNEILLSQELNENYNYNTKSKEGKFHFAKFKDFIFFHYGENIENIDISCDLSKVSCKKFLNLVFKQNIPQSMHDDIQFDYMLSTIYLLSSEKIQKNLETIKEKSNKDEYEQLCKDIENEILKHPGNIDSMIEYAEIAITDKFNEIKRKENNLLNFPAISSYFPKKTDEETLLVYSENDSVADDEAITKLLKKWDEIFGRKFKIKKVKLDYEPTCWFFEDEINEYDDNILLESDDCNIVVRSRFYHTKGIDWYGETEYNLFAYRIEYISKKNQTLIFEYNLNQIDKKTCTRLCLSINNIEEPAEILYFLNSSNKMQYTSIFDALDALGISGFEEHFSKFDDLIDELSEKSEKDSSEEKKKNLLNSLDSIDDL